MAMSDFDKAFNKGWSDYLSGYGRGDGGNRGQALIDAYDAGYDAARRARSDEENWY